MIQRWAGTTRRKMDKKPRVLYFFPGLGQLDFHNLINTDDELKIAANGVARKSKTPDICRGFRLIRTGARLSESVRYR
jgi:hypothetical protein